MKIVAAILTVLLSVWGVWDETETETALKLHGGIVAVYEVQTEEDDIYAVLEAGEDILRSRLDTLSYSCAEVELLKNERLKVTVPGADSVDALASLTAPTANFEFLDANGTVIMNEEHISSANVNYAPVANMEQCEYHVVIEFTKEGRELLAKATEKAKGLADIGENYIDIVVDGMIVSHAFVYETIVSDTVTISGGFDEDAATQLAALIDSSRYSMEFVLVGAEQIKPSVTAE